MDDEEGSSNSTKKKTHKSATKHKGSKDGSEGGEGGVAGGARVNSHKKKKVESLDVRKDAGEGEGAGAGTGAGGHGGVDAPSPFRKMTEGQRRLQEQMLAQYAKE